MYGQNGMIFPNRNFVVHRKAIARFRFDLFDAFWPIMTASGVWNINKYFDTNAGLILNFGNFIYI